MTASPALHNRDALAASNSLADLAARIKQGHEATSAALKDSLAHAMAVGDLLIEAKEQLKHGQWLPWLKSCGVSERMAQCYLKLARNRAVIEANPTRMSDLGIGGALALLSIPRQSKDSLVDGLAGLADLAVEQATGLWNWERDAFEAVKERRLAMLDDARVNIEKLAETNNDDGCAEAETFIAKCEEIRAAIPRDRGKIVGLAPTVLFGQLVDISNAWLRRVNEI